MAPPTSARCSFLEGGEKGRGGGEGVGEEGEGGEGEEKGRGGGEGEVKGEEEGEWKREWKRMV